MTTWFKHAYVVALRSARSIAESSDLLVTLERSPSRRRIWLRSLFSIYDSIDLITLDLPWWTFSAMDSVAAYLEDLQGKARVFEFGAGASTVWLARRAKHVISVEHDIAFAQQMQPVFDSFDNIHLEVAPPEPIGQLPSEALSRRPGYENLAFDRYVATISHQEIELFDLIIIDGRARNACLSEAIPRLKPGGLILFDNSNRSEYRERITSSGLREERLRGLTPALPFPSQTSLLRKSNEQ